MSVPQEASKKEISGIILVVTTVYRKIFVVKNVFVVGTNQENLTHDIFLTMNNYHGQHIVTRARACLIFVDGPDNEN